MMKDSIGYSRMFAQVMLFLVLVALGGCASNGAAQLTAAAEAPYSHDYLIGPGDTLNIQVWRHPEISLAAPVRPDGKLTTPLVEDMQASGKTSTQLARDIETALSKYVQQPVVTVTITGFGGPYGEQIRIIGQAVKPQALPYRNGMSLMDVMIAVGGITPFASGNSARLVRTVGGKEHSMRVRLNDLIKDGDLSANMPLRPGDVLVIPESFF